METSSNSAGVSGGRIVGSRAASIDLPALNQLMLQGVMSNKPLAFSYIRMSTDAQPLRRQLEQSRAYAAQHGWNHVEELRDIGLSAYHGKHLTKGAWGHFVELVRENKIPKGTFLIIESFDRTDRRTLLKAHALFIELVMAGLNVVTLSDGSRYRRPARQFD
jgi:DNA invertase Pin-like site-specific DNA recombinase